MEQRVRRSALFHYYSLFLLVSSKESIASIQDADSYVLSIKVRNQCTDHFMFSFPGHESREHHFDKDHVSLF